MLISSEPCLSTLLSAHAPCMTSHAAEARDFTVLNWANNINGLLSACCGNVLTWMQWIWTNHWWHLDSYSWKILLGWFWHSFSLWGSHLRFLRVLLLLSPKNRCHFFIVDTSLCLALDNYNMRAQLTTSLVIYKRSKYYAQCKRSTVMEDSWIFFSFWSSITL